MTTTVNPPARTLTALLDRLEAPAVAGVTATPWRALRLARGWQPVQLIGRMKILAGRDGLTLPQTWFLLRLVFLWENHRAAVPGFYAGLLHRVYTTTTARQAG